jgi:predicted naringenin-chalcone synthase
MLKESMPPQVFLERIATATFDHDVHHAFVQFAHGMLQDERARAIFLRMAERAEINHRFSPLQVSGPPQPESVDAYQLYQLGSFPATAQRMQLFARFAPLLMRRALDRLALTLAERTRIRHVLVTSCTGLYAPGLDFAAVDYLGLSPSVERTMIGFMGCYAAINALKQARHIVRSQPEDSVLVINLELCTLHLQQTQNLAEVLSFLVFGDGCAASLVSANPTGFALDSFEAIRLPDTNHLITWGVGDQGFDMVLSGQVPAAIGNALHAQRDRFLHPTPDGEISLWAVHPGGRTVLDAVQEALALPPEALSASRSVLRRFGNMSSATVMFVLHQLMNAAEPGQLGCAMSFGPGLTAETMRFHAV